MEIFMSKAIQTGYTFKYSRKKKGWGEVRREADAERYKAGKILKRAEAGRWIYYSLFHYICLNISTTNYRTFIN